MWVDMLLGVCWRLGGAILYLMSIAWADGPLETFVCAIVRRYQCSNGTCAGLDGWIVNLNEDAFTIISGVHFLLRAGTCEAEAQRDGHGDGRLV